MNEPNDRKRSRVTGCGRSGDLVLKLWTRAGVAAAAAVAFGCLYFFVRQYFKNGVWRFDLPLVNKSLGTAALFLVALSMFLTGVAYLSRRSGRSLAYRKHYGLMGFWTGLVHGAVNHFLLPAVGLHPERKLAVWLSDAPGFLALVLFGAMALLSNAGVKRRLGGETWRRALRYGGYAGLLLAVAHAALLKWTSWTKYVRTFDSVLPSLSLPVAAFAAAAIVLRLAAWISEARKK
ncbi:MAG: ferric reductase-like transmembrane domain-containing protein [Candidatus Aminicenantes bacterium]|nr:ferric reductase-like transmembrane domain-containing protein [Candidatus Aminicenantes bacterium]